MLALLRVEVPLGDLRPGRAAVAILMNMQAVLSSQKPGHVGNDPEPALGFPKADDSFDRALSHGFQLRNRLQVCDRYPFLLLATLLFVLGRRI